MTKSIFFYFKKYSYLIGIFLFVIILVKTDLGDMAGRQIKMLASAMGVNSFGLSKDAAIKLIIAQQKKGAKK